MSSTVRSVLRVLAVLNGLIVMLAMIQGIFQAYILCAFMAAVGCFLLSLDEPKGS